MQARQTNVEHPPQERTAPKPAIQSSTEELQRHHELNSGKEQPPWQKTPQADDKNLKALRLLLAQQVCMLAP